MPRSLLGKSQFCDVELMEKVFSDIIVFPNLGEVACDPAANPSDCPHDRQCKDMDGDGQATCVCDSRYYTTHTNGHCVLGITLLLSKKLSNINSWSETDIKI